MPKGFLFIEIIALICAVYALGQTVIAFEREYRFEPFELFKRRMMFNQQSMKLFDKASISVEYNEKSSKMVCKAKKDITENDTLIEFNEKEVISSAYGFPLKTKFIEFLTNEEYLHNNITKKIILSFHLMFELKGNMTLAFITLGKNNSEEAKQYLNEFRDYLKKRKEQSVLVNYIHNLPLSNRLSHTTWSNDFISEYHLSGTIDPSTEKLKGFYKGFLSQVKNDTLLSQVYSHWLNDSEMNVFLSIFSFVSSRALSIEGDYYLMPFIDVCSHYHPISIEDKIKGVKGRRVMNTEKGELFQIISQGKYLKGSEFSYTYTDDLSNDNLLLNYGLIVQNNTFHNYLFQFDLIDPKYNFYKHLTKNKFNMNLVKLSAEYANMDKLSSTFSLRLPLLNEDLFKFILHYLEYTSSLDKDIQNPQSSILIEDQSLKAYFVYYTTIHKNILSITDKMPQQSLSTYISSLSSDIASINSLYSQIISMNNNTLQETFERLYVYNQLHSRLNKININLFNLENLRVLFSHQGYLFEDITRMQLNAIKQLKLKYKKGLI